MPSELRSRGPSVQTDARNPQAGRARVRVLRSDSLLDGAAQLAIRHGDSTYLLKALPSGQLELSKEPD